TGQRTVCISKAYYMAETELTRGQFRRFVEATKYKTVAEHFGGTFGTPSTQKPQDVKYNWREPGGLPPHTDEHPVTQLDWEDAVEFTKWLSREESRTYRLPTSFEWEFAARAGSAGRFCFGDDP